MAKQKTPKNISISIDLRQEFSFYGELIYGINSDSFARGDESLKISNHQSFIIESKHFLTNSEKIIKNSIIFIQFHAADKIGNPTHLGFLEKNMANIEIHLWLPRDVWNHLFHAITHTKSEQLTLRGTEIFRRKADISKVYLQSKHDTNDLF